MSQDDIDQVLGDDGPAAETVICACGYVFVAGEGHACAGCEQEFCRRCWELRMAEDAAGRLKCEPCGEKSCEMCGAQPTVLQKRCASWAYRCDACGHVRELVAEEHTPEIDEAAALLAGMGTD